MQHDVDENEFLTNGMCSIKLVRNNNGVNPHMKKLLPEVPREFYPDFIPGVDHGE